MNDVDRYIFTHRPSKRERLADYALAIALGLALCLALLHSMDALFY